jgi:hypothetical protein
MRTKAGDVTGRIAGWGFHSVRLGMFRRHRGEHGPGLRVWAQLVSTKRRMASQIVAASNERRAASVAICTDGKLGGTSRSSGLWHNTFCPRSQHAEARRWWMSWGAYKHLSRDDAAYLRRASRQKLKSMVPCGSSPSENSLNVELAVLECEGRSCPSGDHSCPNVITVDRISCALIDETDVHTTRDPDFF